MSIHDTNKARLTPFRNALYDFDANKLERVVADLFADEAEVHLAHPFETLDGPGGLIRDALLPLQAAMPDLERRAS